MKIYNSHIDKVEETEILKHPTKGSFNASKITEATRNSLGFYNVTIGDKPNSSYYNYSESKELVGIIYTVTYPSSDKPLQDVIDYKLSILAYKATEVKEQGITVAGLDIATDAKARAEITEGITYFGRNPNETRRFKHKNGFADATEASIIAIQEALAVHVQNTTISEETHYEAIKPLGSVAEVEAYDITIGW